ncbi:hypothetical protein F5Y15DRAFT_7277 [Xylariaceae sp. FL0016]|nr:hypothetical protein F5Y15DRAFT_7277 [Xylariaceae sp. FL0016]
MATGSGQVISWYICTVAAAIFFFGRCYYQFKKFGHFKLPDYFLLLALCCLIGDLAIQQYMWNRGMADMANASQADFVAIMKMIVPGSVLYVTSLWAIKVALVLFYKTLAAPGTKLQTVYNYTLGFLAVAFLVIFFDILFQCFPYDKRWSSDPKYQCSQKASDINYWLTILLNIFSDVFIICLPISMVMKLQMRLKQKLGVTAIFALGFFVVISSIVRAYYSKRNETMLTCTVSMVETAIAIIAACLPALRSLFLGRHVTQTGDSTYGKHYELSSSHKRTNRSRISTNIAGGGQKSLTNDSEDELFKPDKTTALSGKGITVNTSFYLQEEQSRHSEAV